MRTKLLEILACPSCKEDAKLALDALDERDGDVITGELRCERCGARSRITKGVPRFVPDEGDYCKNFGYQWQRWKDLQIDRLGSHQISERRFFAESPWDRAWLKDKLILDAGCGAGRFTDVAAKYGAHVVACDISAAIDACRDTTAIYGARIHHVQASIYDLPFRKGVFDGVFCYGVIQHTPDPQKTMQTLPAFLRPGGLLAYDFYEKSIWEKLAVLKFGLRRFTPEFSTETNLRLAQTLTAAFFPAGAALARLPLTRHVVGFLPIAVVHDKELTLRQEYLWSLLDTFDWYGPKYEIRQHYRDVMELLTGMGLEDIKGRSGVVTARAPAAAISSPTGR
jgi:SAM-dependent methyltransferase